MRLCYPGTSIPIRRGDLVRWHDDAQPSTVIFVVSTGDFAQDDLGKEWFVAEFGEGVMIQTPGAGQGLEFADCRNITLLRASAEQDYSVLAGPGFAQQVFAGLRANCDLDSSSSRDVLTGCGRKKRRRLPAFSRKPDHGCVPITS